MSKSTVSKLVPKVPRVPGTSRREQYSASTKRALVDVAEELFTENGYAATSLDAIVAGAEVTKGALYHHFSGKQALFEAVFERVEDDAARAIQKALKGHRDPWEKAPAGLRAFLDGGPGAALPPDRDPGGPGGPRLRALPRAGGALDVRQRPRHRAVGARAPASWELDEEMLQTFARIFFGAMSSAGESVSERRGPDAAAASVETAIGFILAGFQALAESGVELPGPATSRRA